jgi:hypothetical protein
MSRGTPPSGEIYLEIQQIARQVKMTAIHADTGVEVVVFGPITASQEDLKRVAIRKLQRRLAQESGS